MTDNCKTIKTPSVKVLLLPRTLHISTAYSDTFSHEPLSRPIQLFQPPFYLAVSVAQLRALPFRDLSTEILFRESRPKIIAYGHAPVAQQINKRNFYPAPLYPTTRTLR